MKKYGLIGYPLTHSFSKRFFTEKFTKENIDAVYENNEIEAISRFPEIIGSNPELVGLNVTIPYKQAVIPFLNELDEAAEKIGAVNTIKILRKNNQVHLKGYNTDTWGFETSLTPLLKNYHKKALILGTGGASKAIKYVFTKLGIDFISASTSSMGGLEEKKIPYEKIDEKMMAERLLIVNATPLGTYPKVETFPPIPYQFLTQKHVLFDLVYNPETTKFMEKGKSRKATVKNGYEMLVQQAIKSYEIWNS